MRITQEMVSLIADKLVSSLLDEEFIIFTEEPSELKEILESIIIEDLQQEEKLNEEVKQIITSHSTEMDKENVDYRRMFQMVKKRLVRERDLVL